jgi:hypothetical protein
LGKNIGAHRNPANQGKIKLPLLPMAFTLSFSTQFVRRERFLLEYEFR